ncbi:GH25 family lysozyme [Aquimarina sp. 2201CG5-10]|uniref:GH25 family lysozyme n=1 Tax=Aquimarina callyspongiae TaxID=3098150 RepID=UPI002AB5AF9B|nr:GH25 family lysozyme [Aquimarina sp. 2201CG5-10]MDY8137774.1 GH25 family lysozyme [Aquimarina sp. 2201CG5-10]
MSFVNQHCYRIIVYCLFFLLSIQLFSQDIAKGIDISKYQGKMITEITDKDGFSFVICKATEGVTYTDPDFKLNWTTIPKKKMIRGAYHFYRTNDDPEQQALFFLEAINTLDSSDIPPILDIEKGGIVGKPSVKKVQDDILKWLAVVEEKTNRCPMIYTNENFANTWLNSKAFSNYSIWLAEYTTNKTPDLPDQWKKKGYAFWQKSDSYKVDSQDTDFDIFNGDKKALLLFIEEN